MSKIKDLHTVNDYCSKFNLSTLHPLVTVLDLSEGTFLPGEKVDGVRYHFYGIFLKQGESCVMTYGRKKYDYQDGTLVFISPGQVVNVQHLDKSFKPAGFALLFHPDLLIRSRLSKSMMDYSFFSYHSNEALHVSERERQLVLDSFEKIRYELLQGIDKHSKELIVSNIELFLKYCTRFYDRQFITRDTVNLGIIEKLESSLIAYIQSGKSRELGTPSVGYFAEQQHLSPNYFGDLVKKETGKSAMEYIQSKVIDVAKEKIYDPDKSVTEIAHELGFKYPQHFSRLFKQHVGYSPSEYRSMN